MDVIIWDAYAREYNALGKMIKKEKSKMQLGMLLLWHRELNQTLSCQHPILELQYWLAAQLLILLPVIVPGKAEKDGASIWTPVTQEGAQEGVLSPGFSLTQA